MLQFARHEWLWLLVLVPILAVVAWLAGRRRASDWKRLGQAGRPRPTNSPWWIGAFVCLVVALAQPRWGFAEGDREVTGSDIVIAIDLSRSMGAEDAVPNRLGLAVEAAKSLLGAIGGEEQVHRVAVVGFAGRGVLRCPLTENLGAVIDSIESLRVGEIEPNGTNLASALDASLEALGGDSESARGSIILFTDGEDHEGTWSGRIESLKIRGVVVHAIAIGDAAAGHVVPTSKSGGGPSGSGPLTFQGATVLSKRRDEPLATLADATGGALIRLGVSPVDLGVLYRSRIEPVEIEKRSVTRSKRLPERFGPFLLGAFFLIIAANGRVESRGFTRRALPRLWLLLIVVAGAAPPTRSAREAIHQGASAYAGGRYDEALLGFLEAKRLEPTHPVILFDEAAALFQLKRFGEAYARYESARSKADPALRTKIDFALGNTAVALGELEVAIRHYNDCIASKSQGKRLIQIREDARLNKEYVESLARRTPAMDQAPSDSDAKPPAESAPREERGQNDPRVTADSGPSPPGGGDLAPKRSRSTGSGGGSDADASSNRLEDQLAKAVENVKQARSRRIDGSSANSSSSDRKDW